MLAPLDLLVLLKLCVVGDRPWRQVTLATDLFVSQSSVNAALKRATAVRLYNARERMPNTLALEEVLVHGVKFFIGVERGGLTRGMPTAWGAPPLSEEIAGGGEPVPVWPDPDGKVLGLAFKPLYPSVPRAAERDPALYQLLAIVDTLRAGGARETKLAHAALRERLHS